MEKGKGRKEGGEGKKEQKGKEGHGSRRQGRAAAMALRHAGSVVAGD
jgi:hypothetical protein